MFSAVITNALEMIAVISGIFYIRKYPDDDKSRYFLYFLIFTLILDLFGWLPYFIYEYKIFSELKHTIFARNEWIFNIYDLISFSFFLVYISSFFEKYKNRIASAILTILFLFIGVSNLFYSKQFYDDIIAINFIIGGILVFIHAMHYILQIISTERILIFYKDISFYLILGLLVYSLVLPPVFIYSSYYVSGSPNFVYIYRIVITVVNIIVYSCYSIGFFVCLKKNKSYS